MNAHPARIYVAGILATPEALSAALDEAQRRHPDATLIYVRDQPAGERAAEQWAARGLPFQPLEPAPPPRFIHDEKIVRGCSLVIACAAGWRPEGNSAGLSGQRAGVPVIWVR